MYLISTERCEDAGVHMLAIQKIKVNNDHSWNKQISNTVTT